MTQPLRIAFPYAGDQYGGSSVSSLLLARALRELGHDLRIMVHGGGIMEDAVRSAGFAPVMLPGLSTNATDAAHHRWQWSQLLSWGPLGKSLGDAQIVHVNDLAMLRRWALPARLSGAKLVNHWRSNFSRSLSVRAGMALSDRIIPISRYSRDRLPPSLHRRCVLEYNPFEQNFLSPEARRSLRASKRAEIGIPEQDFVIATFGSFTVRKNTHRLADVVAALPEVAGRPLHALAFGKAAAPHDTLLDEKMNAPEVVGRLRKMPFVPDPVQWMAACDLVLVPAEREPFGRTPFEAALAGTPSILSSDSGAAEMLRDGEETILVDPRDEQCWIAAVSALLESPGLATRIVSGARDRAGKMAPEAHAARVEAIYLGMLAGSESPACKTEVAA